MENTVTPGVLAQLLRLSPEARKVVAYALLDQEEPKQDKEKHIEQESFYEASNAALELSLHIKRMRAVAECFADDYIDTRPGITCAMAVAHTEEHYESLFNAMFEMIAAIDQEADKLHNDLDGIYKEA